MDKKKSTAPAKKVAKRRVPVKSTPKAKSMIDIGYDKMVKELNKSIEPLNHKQTSSLYKRIMEELYSRMGGESILDTPGKPGRKGGSERPSDEFFDDLESFMNYDKSEFYDRRSNDEDDY